MLTLAIAEEEDTVGMLQGARIQKVQHKEHPADVGTGQPGPAPPVGFLPRGTGGIGSCNDDDGNQLPGVLEDCTNQDFFVWHGNVWETFTEPQYLPPTYDASVYGSDDHWSTIQVNHTGGWQVNCVAYVRTEGQSCKSWCADRDMVCQKGMDDAHWQTDQLSDWLGGVTLTPTDCTLSPVSSTLTNKIYTNEPIDQSENGCNAQYNSQICACAKKRPPKPPQLCAWPVNGPDGNPQLNSTTGLPPLAIEDCTHGDFHAYKGHVNGLPLPTYPADTYGSDNFWNTLEIDDMNPDYKDACIAYVNADPADTDAETTCSDWCTSVGMTCVGGMDDAHWQHEELGSWLAESGHPPTQCTLYPGGANRQTLSENGCNQLWNTQICACKA